jgi:hypothetical protein
MPFFNELDLLDDAQQEAERVAEGMPFASDVDRRSFVFMSLSTAAATTFGFGSKALSQGAGGPPGGGAAGAGRPQQAQLPPVPLDTHYNDLPRAPQAAQPDAHVRRDDSRRLGPH